MTPRSLFNIVLKIFGLFFLKYILEIVTELSSAIVFMMQPGHSNQDEGLIIILDTAILLFYVLIAWLFFFKTNKILAKLKLDRDFKEEQFSFDIPISSVLTIALIVMGGIILTNEIPNLCNAIYQYIQQERIQRYSGDRPHLSYIILVVAKIIIALLIIGERRRIVAFAGKREAADRSESSGGD